MNFPSTDVQFCFTPIVTDTANWILEYASVADLNNVLQHLLCHDQIFCILLTLHCLWRGFFIFAPFLLWESGGMHVCYETKGLAFILAVSFSWENFSPFSHMQSNSCH